MIAGVYMNEYLAHMERHHGGVASMKIPSGGATYSEHYKSEVDLGLPSHMVLIVGRDTRAVSFPLPQRSGESEPQS